MLSLTLGDVESDVDVDVGSDQANHLTLCHIHHKIKPFWALEAPFWGQNHRFKNWTQIIVVRDKSFSREGQNCHDCIGDHGASRAGD
jgi:hypothetical protein